MTPKHDRRRPFDPCPQIHLADQARDTLTAAGRRSRDRERGGILVGYREGPDIYVVDALPVLDPTAGHSTYLRRFRPAEAVLTTYLNQICASSDDCYLGYVGEWHTHPLAMPPSSTDSAAMRAMARLNRHAVAMIVVARHSDTSVSLHGLVSTPQTTRHRLSGRHVTSAVRTN